MHLQRIASHRYGKAEQAELANADQLIQEAFVLYQQAKYKEAMPLAQRALEKEKKKRRTQKRSQKKAELRKEKKQRKQKKSKAKEKRKK